MFEDAFYQTHQSEIFLQSRCMQQESTIMNFFQDCLTNLDYITQDPGKRVWKREQKTVIVCLADDFNVCGANLSQPPTYWFDSNTIVITDNHITVPTQYQVCQLPTTYFGIFSYQPQNQNYRPQRRFNFSVNRMDLQRLLILVEYVLLSNGLQQINDQDFVNFNAWDASGNNNSLSDIKHNFLKHWDTVQSDIGQRYQPLIDQILEQIPIKNHDMTIEQANAHSWLIPVIETYSGNVTMAFSEKIFRALQTPVPWTVYSTTGAVEYLKSLGFDVLDDMVDHSYNTVKQDSPYGTRKINAFVSASLQAVERLKGMTLSAVQHRCLQASVHNQQLLAEFKKQWPKDFASWLPTAMSKIL